MEIQSFFGKYYVHFVDDIPYQEVLNSGDIAIVDKKIYNLYAAELDSFLTNKNTILIEATEEQKSYSGAIPIIEELIKRGFHKNNALVAIGGGITQDIVAFISSILYRGVQWKLIPTTLLAQCDSCIGSKTSINFTSYKNQIGGFYPAHDIYISPRFLGSLEQREIKSGLGEMLHYYIVSGEDDFRMFSDLCIQATQNSAVMQELIKQSLEIKKKYIEKDEFDKGIRQLFNYGHSFGHAIESLTNYELPHGIAVSHGIDMANYVAVRMGLQKSETRNRIKNVAALFWSENDISEFDVDVFIELLKKDKKNKGNSLGLILCSDFGSLNKYMVENDDSFREILVDYARENILEDNDMAWEAEMNIAKSAATAAGEYLLKNNTAIIDNVFEKDIKLVNDKESEEIIIDKLKNTDIPVLSEESGEVWGGYRRDLRWIVDPLDGSANYWKGMDNLACVSIALWNKDEPILGVVYRFAKDDLYYGTVGDGAFLNDNRIYPSKTDDYRQAILATGFPVKRSYDNASLEKFIRQIQGFKKIRMLGAAALMGTFVAEGKVDVYTEEEIMLWDIAAATAIVKAAGGSADVKMLEDNKCICRLFGSEELKNNWMRNGG